MKFSKKWKICSSIIGTSFLITTPLTITLLSCSKSYKENENYNDESKPLSHSYEEWTQNLKDENEPLFGVDIKNWNKINDIYKTKNNNFLPFYSDSDLFNKKETALEKSKKLLSILTHDKLMDIFLISFNNSFYKNIGISNEEDITTMYHTFNDKTYFKKPVNIEYKTENKKYIKSFIDIQDFQFDKQNLIVSFKKNAIYSTSNRSYEFVATCGDLSKKFTSKIPTIIVTSQYLKFKIKPNTFTIKEKFIPIISLDDELLEIKNINSKYFAYNELKDNYFSSDFYDWLNKYDLVTEKFNNYIMDNGYLLEKKLYKSIINAFCYDDSSLGFDPGKLNGKYVVSSYPILTDFWKNTTYRTVDNNVVNNLYDTLVFGVGIDYDYNFINLEIPNISLLYLQIVDNTILFIK